MPEVDRVVPNAVVRHARYPLPTTRYFRFDPVTEDTEEEESLRVNAYPGHSEHHTGQAVDIGSPDCEHLSECFEATRDFRWLREHARRFGFSMSYPRGGDRGVIYEPWHWLWRVELPAATAGDIND